MNPNQQGDLFKQVSKVRKDIDRVQEELKDRYVEASVESDGKELVEVTFNGQQELARLSLDPSLFEGEVDVELLEDLISAAVNKGLTKSKALMNEEMDQATGGLTGGFPGLF